LKCEERKKHVEYCLATEIQLEWHMLRNDVLLPETIEGRMEGNAFLERKRLHVLSDVASSAKYLEVKGQQKIEKDAEL